MIDLLQYVVRFCDNIKTEKHVQEDNSEVIGAICSITHWIKK